MKQKKRWCLRALVGTRAVALIGTRTQDAYYSHLISASAVCEIQIDHRLRGKGRGAELVFLPSVLELDLNTLEAS
jgi:hypothetical protein